MGPGRRALEGEDHEGDADSSAPAPRPPRASAPAASGVARLAGARLALLLLACLPSLGTLAAPWISDDALILGHVQRHGALEDWLQPQYGLITVRFWRPLVSLSWDLQESLFGVDPLPFRALNLVCHALAALLVLELARALGARLAAAFLAGLACAWFPEQGGTVTWVAGRVDSLTLPLFVGALLALVRGRAAWAALAAFLACASKETAFALPALGFVLAACRGVGDGLGRRVRAFAALVAACALAFAWRRLALGAWIGGYPAADVDALRTAWNVAQALGDAAWPSLAGVALVAALGLGLGTARLSLVLAGLACAALGAAPLFALLADGVLEETNRRTLAFFDLGLCLCLAGALARPPRLRAPEGAEARGRTALAVAACLLVVGARGWLARVDVREWAAGAALAERTTERLRAESERSRAGARPLLATDVPKVLGGAYVLAWGVADRLRAPFPPAPRPVWPARVVFPGPDPAAGERSFGAGYGRIGASFLALEDGLAEAPRLAVSADGFGPLSALSVDERVPLATPDRSEAFVVRLEDAAPFDGLELVLYTELGYQAFPWPASGAGRERVSLMQAFAASDGRVSLGDVWLLAASAEARAAYLELRAWRGTPRETVACSDWIELRWDAAVLDPLR